jgi:hypothetical protein
MASTILLVHSYLRWLVLLAGLLAIAKLANGYTRQLVYTPGDKRFSSIFVGLLDLQFLIGLILYGISPVTRGAMKDMTAGMADPHVRFFVAEHPMMMFLGLVVAHVTSVMVKKSPSDRVKFLRGAMGFALALGLILAGIPWFRLGAH